MEPSPLQSEPLSKHEDAVFGLKELVDVANGLLPAYLPKDAAGRAADDVNPRLVRFYTTEGLLPEPHKEGREARYVYDHLLALLLVRKLLAEGFGSAAIRKALSGRRRADLEALLQDEVRVVLAPSQAARSAEGEAAQLAQVPSGTSKADFLQQVRARAGLATAGGAAPAPTAEGHSAALGAAHGLPLPQRWQPVPKESTEPRRGQAQAEPNSGADAGGALGVDTTWSRLMIQAGLELSVRDDFTWPANHVAEEQLLQQMRVALLQLEQARKRQRS